MGLHRGERLTAGHDPIHRVPKLAQTAAGRPTKQLIIFGQQQPHSNSLTPNLQTP
jgi:hypothetical protein